MEVKILEIRDRGTFMPVMCIRLNPIVESERYLLGRSGYGVTSEAQGEYILMTPLAGGSGHATCDPYDWPGGATTLPQAHKHIIEHWEAISSGDVVDVEFITGQTNKPKVSEYYNDNLGEYPIG
jgi:hypothetical protein